MQSIAQQIQALINYKKKLIKNKCKTGFEEAKTKLQEYTQKITQTKE